MGVPFICSPATAQTAVAPAAASEVDSGQLQEIVVTAQRRSENSQKVPIAITAVGGAQLAARGITSVLDLGGSVPGLQFQNFSGIQLPFLRGVGATGSALGNESSVASYVDGIYFARVPSAFAELRNVQRVEVLKGPQGTLFGRNSTGGVINIVTKDPSHDTSMSGSLGYGRFNEVRGDVYATTGLGEKAAMDISVSGKRSDGFGKNLTTDGHYGFGNGFLARSKLLLEPVNGTRFVLSGFYSWSKDSGQKGGFPGTKTGTVSAPNQVFDNSTTGYYNTVSDDNYDKYKFWGTSLRAEQDLSFAKLISISAYSKLKERHDFEGDYGPRPDFVVPIKGKLDLFTQELQLASKDTSALSWIAGAYYYHNKSNYYDVHFVGPLLFGPAGLSAPAYQKARSFALFGQATYEILPKLKLTGGLRYTWDKTTADGYIAVFGVTPTFFVADPPQSTDKSRKLTFRAAVDYQIDPNALVYASFSRGFKAATYNILTYSGAPNEPEKLDAYEVGFKTSLFDHRLQLNGAGFYYDITNPQVQLVRSGTIFFSNAGSAKVKGVELDAEAALGGGLTTRASATYLDSKYKKYGTRDANGNIVDGAPTSIPDLVNGGSIPAPSIIAAGKRTPLAAKLTLNVGFDYTVDTSIGKFVATADLYHNSGFFFEPDNFLHQKAYDLLNAQLRFSPTDHYSIRVWGRNLLDKKYVIAATSQVSAVHEAGYPFTPGSPITCGVAVDFNF
jgi:iron complex outermembrane receptor protein